MGQAEAVGAVGEDMDGVGNAVGDSDPPLAARTVGSRSWFRPAWSRPTARSDSSRTHAAAPALAR